MAVKIRLARRGRKKLALYDVVVSDSRSPRDGRFIEKVGTYNPLTNPATIHIDNDRAFHWLMQGAHPTPTVRAMLSYNGVLYKKHLQIGVIKGALTQEQADEKLNVWMENKRAKIQSKKDRLKESATVGAISRRQAETKVKEARLELIRKKAEQETKAQEEAKAEEEAKTQEETRAEEEVKTQEETKAEGGAKTQEEAKVEGGAKAQEETKAQEAAKPQEKETTSEGSSENTEKEEPKPPVENQ